MHDVLCCGRCREPLQIVCREHGTECEPHFRHPMPAAAGVVPKLEPRAVPKSVATARVVVTPPPLLPRRTRGAAPSTRALLAFISQDASAPSSTAGITAASGRSYAAVSIALKKLTDEGFVVRVRHGQYVRGERP
ncbi:MAG: hypothetical protein V4617_15215 [Gemmatimonadota bacterium]